MDEPEPERRPRRTQAERREATRAALIAAAGRALSNQGYGALVLADVAADAGYTRGAIYHHFADKDELTVAVARWVVEEWTDEVFWPAAREEQGAESLMVLARLHAVYCRKEYAGLRTNLQVELGGRDHPVGKFIDSATRAGVSFIRQRIEAGRADGSIPPGPEPVPLAWAYFGAVEGCVIATAGHPGHDAVLAERVARGVLGLAPG